MVTLAPARAILLLGHGNGKANASHQWVAYAEKHRKDVAAKVVADLRADIDDLTGHQVVQLRAAPQIQLREPAEELGQVVHRRVAEDLALAVLVGAQPLGQVRQQAGELGGEGLLVVRPRAGIRGWWERGHSITFCP